MASSQAASFLLDLQLLRDRVPSFAGYPFCLPAVRQLQTLAFHPRVTFLVGENGSGKSTLLEAIAVAYDLNPEGGSRNFNFATRASHSGLDRFLRLARSPRQPRDSFFLRAESFYNVATEIERLGVIRAYGDRSLHEQSHGESFFALFEHRFRAPGLYLLDEPEAALSPARQMSFLALLHQHCEADSQFLIATHSPIIMAYPHAWIYVLGAEGPARTDYTDTEHYRITRAFLTKTEKMLAVLLETGEQA
ncbi:MAG: AAA family ATPase [Gemmataceae bacterium]